MTWRVSRVGALSGAGVLAAFVLAALFAVSAIGAAGSGPANRGLISHCARLATGDGRAPARAVGGSADPRVRAELSIFRAPRTSSDVLPVASTMGRALAAANVSTYDPSASVRLDLKAGGAGSVYAVPARLAAPSLPPRCAHLRRLAGLRALLGLQRQETGTGSGVCLIATRVVAGGRPTSILPGKRRPKERKRTLASAGCESLTVMGGYLGVLGGALSRSGFPVALVPDGVTSVTYAFAGGGRRVEPVRGNLLTLPAALRRPIRAARASRAKLRRSLAARVPVAVTEKAAGGAVVASLTRPPGLVEELVRLVLLLKRSTIVNAGAGSENVFASCSARTHRCVAVVMTTSCAGGHHRCTTTRRIDRYRYAGARPPRGTTGRVVPTAPVRARLNRYVVHPRRLSLVLGGTPHDRVDVLASVSCFSGRGSRSVSGEVGPPLQVAVPSRTPLALPNRHRACDVDVLVVSAQRGPGRARLIHG